MIDFIQYYKCVQLFWHTRNLPVTEGNMRNKVTNFPNQNNNKLEGEPRAKAEYASRRADGTINTHPQERMYASSHREDDTSAVIKDH
jgi:small acid-soluble spore protein K (minor)